MEKTNQEKLYTIEQLSQQDRWSDIEYGYESDAEIIFAILNDDRDKYMSDDATYTSEQAQAINDMYEHALYITEGNI